MISHTRTVTRIAARAGLIAVLAAAPAAAQTPVTFTFENVATNPQGTLDRLPPQGGFTFDAFGASTNTAGFGTGSNASSGTRFAYAYFEGPSQIYRLDNLDFSFVSAALSFRTFDANLSPASVVVNGYRGGAQTPAFTRTLALTNSAQTFTFGWGNVSELQFVTGSLSANRSAVLAVDDVTLSTVPEPGSIVLLATGLGAVALIGARRRARG